MSKYWTRPDYLVGGHWSLLGHFVEQVDFLWHVGGRDAAWLLH
jgi:hypothetical protein